MLLLCMRCRFPAVNGSKQVTPATQKPFIGKLPAVRVYLTKSLYEENIVILSNKYERVSVISSNFQEY